MSLSSPAPPAVLLGTGPLADRVADAAADAPDPPAALVVQRLDRLSTVDWPEVGRSVLFVGWWRGLVYIGPLWSPGQHGCPVCLVTRTSNSPAGPDQDGERVAVGSAPALDATAALGPAALRVAGLLVAEVLTAPPGTVLVLDARAGTVHEQPLLADSVCPHCALSWSRSTLPQPPADRPLHKLDAGVLRCRELDDDALNRDLAAAETGLFKHIWHDLQGPFGACSVDLPARLGRREPAIGRAGTFRSARSIALVEGLERYAGLHRGGRPEFVRAPYREVASRAVHPDSFGTHPRECYQRPGFRYRPFDQDVTIDWVRAWSYRQQRAVLVPERTAFWGPRRDGEVSFGYDTSNGCAVGSCTEEAVLHGLRELVERDSFLLTWYRRLRLPEIDLTEVPDRKLRALLRRCTLGTGFDYRAFLSTMEHDMPSVVLLAVGPEAPDMPAVLAGSGAHPDPVQAIGGGLLELAGVVLSMRHSYAERRAAALPMLDDPWLVSTMGDHATVNAIPEARHRFDFLLDAEPTLALRDVPSTLHSETTDLRADLDTAVTGMLGAGLDVLVVDQTMPELAEAGLVCVKVMVPGLLPMTFGHQNRRTENLPRLTGALPWPDGGDVPTTGALPHPFP